MASATPAAERTQTMTTKTAQDLVDTSATIGETVRAPYTPTLAAELQLLCDDSVEASPRVAEYWGEADDEGAGGWRVHLTGRRELEVGDVQSLCTADDERPDPEALDYYVTVQVTCGGEACTVGVCVGARESDHGTVRASGAGVQPRCTAWWVEPDDHASLPAGWRDAVLGALLGASWRLYQQAARQAGG